MGNEQTNANCEAIQRALNYPYPWNGKSYVFFNGYHHPVDKPHDQLRQKRTPVLAYGSNRSAEQLHRKFGTVTAENGIFVEACQLSGFDIIHSAHITSYGSIPAAILPHEKVIVEIAITWLNREQLIIMDASENTGITYGRERITESVQFSDGYVCNKVEVYQSTHGPLKVNNKIVSHSNVSANGRKMNEMTNIDLLHLTHQNFCPDLTFNKFVMQTITDNGFRANISNRLKGGLIDHNNYKG